MSSLFTAKFMPHIVMNSCCNTICIGLCSLLKSQMHILMQRIRGLRRQDKLIPLIAGEFKTYFDTMTYFHI